MSTPLILASSSPQRRKLLELITPDFLVADPCMPEFRHENETPEAMTERLAIAKAESKYKDAGPHVRVLAGDTAVAIANCVLGKPENHDHAVRMLTQLSGTAHTVFSAVALYDQQGCRSLTSRTEVTFRTLHADEIEKYCLTDDPYDKAGGYGIQNTANCFVIKISGSYSGAMGLPLWETHQLLSQQRHADMPVARSNIVITGPTLKSPVPHADIQ